MTAIPPPRDTAALLKILRAEHPNVDLADGPATEALVIAAVLAQLDRLSSLDHDETGAFDAIVAGARRFLDATLRRPSDIVTVWRKAAGTSETSGESWSSVDFDAVLDGTYSPPTTSILRRSDG